MNKPDQNVLRVHLEALGEAMDARLVDASEMFEQLAHLHESHIDVTIACVDELRMLATATIGILETMKGGNHVD